MATPEILSKARRLSDFIDRINKRNGDLNPQLLRSLMQIDSKIREIVKPTSQRVNDFDKNSLMHVLEKLHTGVMIVDAKTRKIDYMNQSALDMLGLEKKDVIGRICHKFICPKERGECPVIDLGLKVEQSEKELIGAHKRRTSTLKTVNEITLNGEKKLLESFVDITQKQMIQEAIESSELKFRELFDHLQTAAIIYSWDESKKTFVIGEINRKAQETDMVKEREVRLKTIGEAYPGLMQTDFAGMLKEVLETGLPRTLKTYWYDDDRVVGFRDYYIYRLPDNEVVAIFSDVTKQVGNDARIREMTQAIEQSRVAVVITDIAGTIEYVNPFFCKITGYNFHEAIGENPRILKSGKHSTEFYEKLWDTITSGNVWEGELCNHKKDGSEFWEKAIIGPIFNDKHEITNFIAIKQDITATKNAEKKLLEIRNETDQFLATAADGLRIVDKTGTIIKANDTFLKMTGLKREEVVGKKCFEVIHDKDCGTEKCTIKRIMSGEDHIEHDTILRVVNGREIPVISTVRPFYDLEGNRIGFVQNLKDITEREKIKKQIEEQLNFVDSLLDAIPNPVFSKDKNGKLLSCNPAFEQCLGLKEKDVIGKPVSKLFPKEFLSVLQKEETQLFEKGSKIHFESFLDQGNGKGKRILYSGGPFIQNGKIAGSIGIISDITELTRIQEELKASREQYRLLIENMGEGIAITSVDDYFIFANPAAEKIFGVGPNGLLNRSLNDFLPPSEIDRMKIETTKRREGIASKYEVEIIRPNGEKRVILVTATPKLSPDGALIGTFGIFRDVTERVEQERALRESEEKYRSIIDNIQDVYYRSDRRGRLIMVSPSGLKLLGYSQIEDLLGKNIILDLFKRKEDSSKFLKTLHKEKQVTNYELELVRQDGKPVTVLTSSSFYYDKNGNIAGVEGILTDITGRKQYEKKLKKAKQEAERANKSKSEFLANMSHEIRTPMNAILGFAEALAGQVRDPGHKKMLDSILSSGNLLLALINDILDLSKIEAGKLVISPQPTDLAQILEEIKLIFSERMQAKGLDFHLYVPVDFPESLRLDEIRIRQIIINLVGNALKFTHKGYIELKAEFHQTTAKAGDVILSVTDTGIGIPPDQHKRIFEVFQQQEGQIDRQYKGVGLGLAISKKLAEKMNGSISLESEPGKGSTFTVTLHNVELTPVVSHAAGNKSRKPKVRLKKATILVVDDVDLNIEVVKSYMQDTEVSVREADSCEMALEILEYERPDAILLDIRMPGIGGFETARRIKDNPKTREIPVIAYTASVLSLHKIQESGWFDAELMKPASKYDLFKTLAEFLPHEKIKDSNDSGENDENREKEPEVKPVPQELIELIDGSFLPVWETIKDKLLIFKIENFASDLNKAAVKWGSEYLEYYSKQLLNDLQNMDFDSIRKRLSRFGDVVKSIKETTASN
ncbi:MAG: hypothetical protein Kow00127_05550 [Bacteroidales bacterium]